MKTYLLRDTLREKNRIKSHHSESGFSLVELAVIVVIIGIFSAIAAPAWNAFITRQRVRSVNGQVLQALQTAQAEAKRTKQEITVTFEYDSTSIDPPQVTINGNRQTLDLEGQIQEEMIELSPSPATITFNHLGSVENTNLPFQVVVSPSRVTNPASQQCVIVQTLLGAMRTAEGGDCP